MLKINNFFLLNFLKFIFFLLRFNTKKNVKKKIVDEFSEIKLSNIFESDASFLPYEIIQKFELKVFITICLLSIIDLIL